MRVEDKLADPDRLRGHLDAFVILDELEGLFEGEFAGRDESLKHVGRGGTHVR